MPDDNQFEEYRPLLFSIAYRMMGTAMEAEDVVQDAYLRYVSAPTDEIRSHKYYLTTIVTRLCINRLNSAREQRESYLGPWLPEPIVTANHPELVNPADKVGTYDSISMAFLILLEKLSPAERAIFLLREVFDYDYDEIASIVGKNESACRQLFSRAKKHIRDGRPRYESTPEEHEQIFRQFMHAVEAGELDGLVTMLADDATLLSDGGTRRGRATRPVYGAANVARFILGIKRLGPESYRTEVKIINGKPGVLMIMPDGALFAVVTLEIADGKVWQVHVNANEEKLKNV